MRLVQVAKILGMTGQELRHELSTVNFGVKPTDREVPDGLAKGVIRFIAQKKGMTIDIDAIMNAPMTEEGSEGEAPVQEQEAAVQQEEVQQEVVHEAAKATSVKPKSIPGESLPVLRKLTLEGVSKDAIDRQKKDLQDRRDMEEAKRPHLAPISRQKPTDFQRQEQIKKKEGPVTLPEAISVKELAEKTGVQVPKIIQALMKNGVMATITQSIDYDTAAIVATELGIEVLREERAASAEALLSQDLSELIKDEPENLKPRPPIVVVMGHVDHGKTALLDAIRNTDVVSQEHGGITQHIGATQVEHETKGIGKRLITFLDTPGHEAFTAMRARGAQITDIVILVVSAEEGVRDTTIEAMNHAKDAGVPIIVAVTKMDKERADVDRVKGEVAGHGLQPEEWGGPVPFVPCSAVTKQGIPELLDQILLVSELQELKANPNRNAIATVIESHLDTSMGALATVIVNTGTLRIGDICVCGDAVGRVKALLGSKGERLQDVLPSHAARLSGLDGVPAVGDILQVVPSEREARTLKESISQAKGERKKHSFADLVSRLSEGKLTNLKVVLKADAQGSLEAIQYALANQQKEDDTIPVTVKVIHGAVGAVSENDVMMAAASEAVVLAFHAPVPVAVSSLADREGIKIREYTILYELLDEVEKLREGLIIPVEEEKILGHMNVLAIFLTKKGEQIVGGRVTDGILKRVQFRLMRAGEQVGTGRITSIKHVDKDIKEAKEGSECGLRVDSSVPVMEGDVIEAFHKELKRKEGV